ncbi:MAG: hypothetical protein U1D30_18680 [Planctomycetota bacterium]
MTVKILTTPGSERVAAQFPERVAGPLQRVPFGRDDADSGTRSGRRGPWEVSADTIKIIAIEKMTNKHMSMMTHRRRSDQLSDRP